jgi:solute:Na+ symporter, SSS family
MLVVQKYYSPWVLGFVAGAGCLAALIPASTQILGAASIISKNLFIDYGMVKTDAGSITATRILVLVVSFLAFSFWFFARQTLVGLLLIAYTGITQFFPGVALSFSRRLRPNAAGAATGIVVGVITLAILAASKTNTFAGINSGFVALILNVIALFTVSALTGAYRRSE